MLRGGHPGRGGPGCVGSPVENVLWVSGTAGSCGSLKRLQAPVARWQVRCCTRFEPSVSLVDALVMGKDKEHICYGKAVCVS
ncbi:hypothetical protein NDU88_006242 [Pleurodeles waltl]|uniref:Uncharacterized protein n=1 Tax=Pleurodeles waltl TaxID=8319 RepID=A0AAV7NPR6_PLEWA|nr:hypothetical protein NDU88_006242 [Pleurodeles waltl]